MELLQITLFGSTTVVHTRDAIKTKLPRSTQVLLAYLLIQRHLVSRELLMDLFWLDSPPQRARSNLTTAIWRLRNILEPDGIRPGTYLLTENSGEVGFNWESDYWLDTESFERVIQPVLRKSVTQLASDDIDQLEMALGYYQGELLEGVYDDWALRERERFRSLYLDCLTRMMQFYASKRNFDRSIAYAQAILRRDPLREQIHRDLMCFYLENGQQVLAIRQYEACRRHLKRELGIFPLEETQALYWQIVAGFRHQPTDQRLTSPPEAEDLLQDLHAVKQSLIALAHSVERLAQVANHLAGNR